MCRDVDETAETSGRPIDVTFTASMRVHLTLDLKQQSIVWTFELSFIKHKVSDDSDTLLRFIDVDLVQPRRGIKHVTAGVWHLGQTHIVYNIHVSNINR